jgi:hypothetical protein
MTSHGFTSGGFVQERGESGRNKTAKRHGKNAMALPLPRVLRSFVWFRRNVGDGRDGARRRFRPLLRGRGHRSAMSLPKSNSSENDRKIL